MLFYSYMNTSLVPRLRRPTLLSYGMLVVALVMKTADLSSITLYMVCTDVMITCLSNLDPLELHFYIVSSVSV